MSGWEWLLAPFEAYIAWMQSWGVDPLVAIVLWAVVGALLGFRLLQWAAESSR